MSRVKSDPQENLHVALANLLKRPTTASNKVLLADVEQLMREHRGVTPARVEPAPPTAPLFDLADVAS